MLPNLARLALQQDDTGPPVRRSPRAKQARKAAAPYETSKPKPSPEFYQAVKDGNLERVQELIAAGANVNHVDDDGETALIHASWKGHAAVVAALLAAGAAVNHAYKDGGWTALMMASSQGRTAVVTMLLAAGANVNQTDDNGHTALMWASNGGHAAVVAALLDAGADVNHAYKDGGWTALMMASSQGRRAVVAALLAAPGIDVNKADRKGRTALMVAIRERHTAVVKMLLAAGASVNQADKDGDTALMKASEHAEIMRILLANGANADPYTLGRALANGYNDIAYTLLEKGVNVDDASVWFEPPPPYRGKMLLGALAFAARSGDVSMVRAMLKAGANVNMATTYGNTQTALMTASVKGHFDIVEALLAAGADTNRANPYDNKTALLYAIENDHIGIFNLLMRSGVDVNKLTLLYNIINGEAVTPLILTATLDRFVMCKALIAAGVDVNKTGEDGVTPLMWASRNGHADIVAELLTAGASKKRVVKLDSTDKNGNIRFKAGETAVDIARRQGYMRIVRLLDGYLSIPERLYGFVAGTSAHANADAGHDDMAARGAR
jgi:hypothetical protein